MMSGGEPYKICKDGASKSKSNNDGVCDVNDVLQKLSTGDKDNNDVSVCANCGKEGSSDTMNTCNKCKQVKYCNAACKKKHRTKHKKHCERLVAKKHDEVLFKEPPLLHEDCPICFLRMPCLASGSTYYACCGKTICNGCAHAPVYDNQGNKVAEKVCPFCRTPPRTSDEELIKRYKKRMEKDDPIAFRSLGWYYFNGLYGLPQDYTKALELYHRAAELGNAIAYTNIGFCYFNGRGVEVDQKKASHYYELSAMGGVVQARNHLGAKEGRAANFDRALRHYMIAIKGGDNDSLMAIQALYSEGFATKDDYTKALKVYQVYLGEIKSDQRDEAAAADKDYRYY